MSIRQKIKLIMQILPTAVNTFILQLHGVKISPKCKVLGGIRVVNKGSIIIGERCTLDGKCSRIGYIQPVSLTTQKNAIIRIGDHVGISNCTFYATCSIEVGDHTLIGGGVKVYDTNFHSVDWRFRNTSEDKSHTVSSPVSIGKHCFIGAGSIILKGFKVGDNSIVAAGSVVTHSIPKNEIWGGNPAKKIKAIEFDN